MGQALLIVCRLLEQKYMLNPLPIELPSAQKQTGTQRPELAAVLVFFNVQPGAAAD
jgi:hypothetical protein